MIDRDKPTPYRIDVNGKVWWKNTFAPKVNNTELPTDGVRRMLFLGFQPSSVPKDVLRAVEESVS